MLFALHCLSSLCLVIVVWLFLVMSRGCLQYVIVVFPDNTHYFCNVDVILVDVLQRHCLMSNVHVGDGTYNKKNVQNAPGIWRIEIAWVIQ